MQRWPIQMTVVLMRREERKQVIPFVHSTDNSLAAAASRPRLHTLSLSDLYCWLVICCGRSHSFLDLASHGQESLLDVAGVFRRCLKEWDTKAVSKFLKTHKSQHSCLGGYYSHT